MWLVLSLLAAVSDSLKDAFGKWGSVKTDEYTAAVALHLFTAVVSIPLIIMQGIPLLTSPFWWGTLGFLVVTPLWTISYMKALRLAPLSEVLPIMAFNPIMTALLAFLFQGQGISITGWYGIFLISLGIYSVYLKPDIIKKGILEPIKSIFISPGARYMFVVALMWSIGAYLGKWRVDGSSPIFSTFSSGLVGIVTTLFVAGVLGKPIKLNHYLKHGWSLLPIGIFYYLASITSSYALVSGTPAYVFSIKRGSIVLSAILGKLFFKENLYRAKVIGLSLIVLGIYFLSL